MNFERRVEFVLLFDVTHGNPNGDPDAGNAPRVDPETGHGIVTDVCLKRKIRNFVAHTKGYTPPYDIFIKERGILAREQRKAYEAVNAEPMNRPNDDARRWMCDNYFDVRTFGAVMTTGRSGQRDDSGSTLRGKDLKLWNCGQVRGPAQLGFARSVAPVLPLNHAITRAALTNVDDTNKVAQPDPGGEKAASQQIGRKYSIPYGLYRTHGFISPFLARDTGFNTDDYDILIESLTCLFDHDRSASRGEMAVRALGIFTHETALGNARAHDLFELVRVEGPEIPRKFSDYMVSTPTILPKGVGFHWEVPPA